MKERNKYPENVLCEEIIIRSYILLRFYLFRFYVCVCVYRRCSSVSCIKEDRFAPF